MRLLWAVLVTGGTLAGEPLIVPFFKQEKNGCGAASVAMVMRYWRPGSPAAGEVYQRLYDARRKGIPLAEMKRYLQEQGFQAFTLRGEWPDLEQHVGKGRPVIVALKKNRRSAIHFAVMAGVEDGHVTLNDPTRKGAQSVEKAKFLKQWELAERWMLLATPQKE